MTTNYGYSRLIMGKERDGRYEYFDSMLESDFPDITTYVKFTPGRYLMFVEVDDPRLADNFEATLSYYCLLYTSPSPRDQRGSRMPSSA